MAKKKKRSPAARAKPGKKDAGSLPSGSEEKKKSSAGEKGPVPAGFRKAVLPRLQSALHPGALAFLVFLLAFWVRVYVAHFYAKGPDNFQYLALAEDIARGDYFKKDFDLEAGLASSRKLVPLYPALIAIGIKLGADPERWGTWVSIFLGAATVFPLMGIGLLLGDKWTGAGAGLFFSLLPLSIETAGHILTEPTFGFLTAAACYTVLRFFKKPSVFLGAACGAVSALSYLTRDIGFGYIFLSLIVIGVSGAAGCMPSKNALRAATAALLAFVFLSFPYWAFIKVHTGTWSVTLRIPGDFKAELMGYEKGTKPRAAVDEGEEQTGTTAGSEPGRSAAESGERFSLFKVLSKSIKLYYQYIAAAGKGYAFPFYIFVFLGVIVGSWRERETRWLELAALIWPLSIIAAYAVITPYMVDTRYALPAITLFCVYAGRAAARLPLLAREISKDKAGKWPAVIAGILVAAGTGYHLYLGAARAEYIQNFYSPKYYKYKTVAGQKEVAEDVKKLFDIPRGTPILARKPYFCYYLDARYVLIGETPEEVNEQLARGEAEYAFVGSLSVRRYRPGLKMLVTAEHPLPAAGLVYRRFFPKFDKIFSLYKRGAPRFQLPLGLSPSPSPETIEKAFSLGRNYFNQGYLEHARQVFVQILEADPDYLPARRELIKLYTIYGFFDGVSLDRAEDELRRLAFVSPRDPMIEDYRKLIASTRKMHESLWAGRDSGGR